MKNQLIILTTAFLITAVFMGGCKKDNDTSPNDNQLKDLNYRQAASEFQQNEMICNDAENMADDIARGANPNTLAACATVTHDTVSIPHVMTIDFGPVNCLGNDGRWRRGQIIITHSGSYFSPGSVKTTTFNNYYVNDNHVEGTRTIENNGLNSANNMNWTIEGVNMKITKPNGTWHVWNTTRNREMISGASTPAMIDDVYSITGTSSGNNNAGMSRNANIITPLIKEMNCKWFVSGTIEITPSNHPTRILDYGNGACDNIATVTVNGNTHTITLN